MGSSSSISPRTNSYSLLSLTSFSSTPPRNLTVTQESLDKLPVVINSALRECMHLISIYPSFRASFLSYFSTGKWVTEFLDSNSNVMAFMIASHHFSNHENDSTAVAMNSSTSSTPTSFGSSLTGKPKNMTVEIRGDLTRQYTFKVGSNIIKNNFPGVEWLKSSCDEQTCELLAVLLIIAYPIYVSSYEFQCWLEYTEFDVEEDQIMKRKIEKETMLMRVETDSPQLDLPFRFLDEGVGSSCVENDEYRDRQSSQFEVPLHRSSASKICLLHQRYSSSDIASRPGPNHDRLISARGRLKATIHSVISSFSLSQNDIRLEQMLATTAWSQAVLSFLHNIRIPIVIACTRNHAKNVSLRDRVLQGLKSQSDFHIVHVNKAYEELTGYTLAEIQKSSMSELLLGKVPTILEHHCPAASHAGKLPSCSPNHPHFNNANLHSTSSANASSLVQMTVKSLRKDHSSFTNVTIMKPVHHVLANPDYHYVVATQYDLTPFLQPGTARTGNECYPNCDSEAGISPFHHSMVRYSSASSTTIMSNIASRSRSHSDDAAGVLYKYNAAKIVPDGEKPTGSMTSTVFAIASVDTSSSFASSVAADMETACSIAETCSNSSSGSRDYDLGSQEMKKWPNLTPLSISSPPPMKGPPLRSTSRVGSHGIIHPGAPCTSSLSSDLYAQFKRDLPMIEDCLNIVPQFLY